RRVDCQCAVDKTQGVIGGVESAAGRHNVIRAHRRVGAGNGAQGRCAAQHALSVVVHESAVVNGQDRVGLAVEAGQVVGRDGQQGLADRQGAVGEAKAVIGGAEASGFDHDVIVADGAGEACGGAQGG